MNLSKENILQFLREFWVHIKGICTIYGICILLVNILTILLRIIFGEDKLSPDKVSDSLTTVITVLLLAGSSYRSANKKIDTTPEKLIMTQEEFDRPLD